MAGADAKDARGIGAAEKKGVRGDAAGKRLTGQKSREPLHPVRRVIHDREDFRVRKSKGRTGVQVAIERTKRLENRNEEQSAGTRRVRWSAACDLHRNRKVKERGCAKRNECVCVGRAISTSWKIQTMRVGVEQMTTEVVRRNTRRLYNGDADADASTITSTVQTVRAWHAGDGFGLGLDGRQVIHPAHRARGGEEESNPDLSVPMGRVWSSFRFSIIPITALPPPGRDADARSSLLFPRWPAVPVRPRQNFVYRPHARAVNRVCRGKLMHHDDHQCNVSKRAQTLCCTADPSLDEPGRAGQSAQAQGAQPTDNLQARSMLSAACPSQSDGPMPSLS